MKNSTQLKLVLDACVLYPAPIRDVLLSIAAEGLFKVFWSDKIQEEWLHNLLKNRSDLKEVQLKKTIEAMDLAFPDATVSDFNELIENIELPDTRDRHVVACGIKSKSEMIITFNLKDFPAQELSKFDMKALRPDDLILNLLSTSPQLVCKGFRKMINRLQNPIKTKKEVLASLKKCGFTKGITELRNLC